MKDIRLSNLYDFNFKVVIKHKTTPVHTGYRKVSRKVYCLCVEDENEPNNFMAHINLKNKDEFTDVLVIPFTSKSYELQGKLNIFSKTKDKHNHIVRIIRDNTQAKLSPVDPELYTPFRNNYVYSGYIVKVNDKHYFDVRECYDNVKYCQYLLDSADPIKL